MGFNNTKRLKFFSIIFILLIIFFTAGCGKKVETNNNQNNTSNNKGSETDTGYYLEGTVSVPDTLVSSMSIKKKIFPLHLMLYLHILWQMQK